MEGNFAKERERERNPALSIFVLMATLLYLIKGYINDVLFREKASGNYDLATL
jgi:hypothetical protein